MKTETEYFNKRDRDVLSGFGTVELEYICKEISNRRIYKEKKDKIKILDIGCGSGMGMLRMTKEFLHLKDVKGVDLSPFAIKIAKEQRMLDCQVGNAEDLKNFKDDEFDVAYGLHVLEHTDAVKTMNAALRVAKKVIFIFPIESKDKEDAINEKEFEFKNDRQKTLFHNKEITYNGLSKILRKVPNERHRIVKNVITYMIHGTHHSNCMLVLYRETKK